MLKVKIITFTPNPEEIVATSAAQCYSSSNFFQIKENLTPSKIRKRIEKCIRAGHHSVLEHANFTFFVEGISRATSHQLVRHRIASYSQQSQRYVKFKDQIFILPESIAKNREMEKIFTETMKRIREVYQKFLEGGIPPEDARYILPNAIETKIVITMNARELLHFFKLRLCKKAQWEIRKMAKAMLEEVKKVAPIIFRRSGPPCFEGECPEGDLSCFEKMKVERSKE